MLKLYEPANFKLLQEWVTDADLLLQFSGTDFTFPLSLSQISEYQARYPDRNFYIGYTDNQPFAFGEIITQEDQSPRLARILIGDPALRGKGLGKYFIKLLVEECRRSFDSNHVDLYIWDKNLAAIRCYQSAGFRLDTNKLKTMVHNNIDYDIYKMTYSALAL